MNASTALESNKVYRFQDWKLACGGTQFYNMVQGGAAPEFSYAPLTCKILGHR